MTRPSSDSDTGEKILMRRVNHAIWRVERQTCPQGGLVPTLGNAIVISAEQVPARVWTPHRTLPLLPSWSGRSFLQVGPPVTRQD